MTERDFTSELARSVPWTANALGESLAWFKIPDSPCKGPTVRFVPVKAYDAFLVHRGQHLALEAKLAKHPSIAFDALREEQEHALLAVAQAGGRAFVLVNFRITFSAKEAKRRKQAKAILTFAVPIATWLHQRAEACRSSLPLAWFECNALALPRVRVGEAAGWDLRPLLAACDPAQGSAAA